MCSLHRRGVSLWFVVYLPLWGDLFICVNSRIEQPAFSLPVCGLECCVTITAHTNQCNIDFSSCFFLFGMYSKQAILHSSPLVSARESIFLFAVCFGWTANSLCVVPGVRFGDVVWRTFPGVRFLETGVKFADTQWCYNRHCIINDLSVVFFSSWILDAFSFLCTLFETRDILYAKADSQSGITQGSLWTCQSQQVGHFPSTFPWDGED